MFEAIWCYFFHKPYHFWYGNIKLCEKCDHSGGPGVKSGFGVRVKLYNAAQA